MKNLSVLFTLLVLSQQVSAVTIKDLVGTYEITHPIIPVVNIVRISPDAKVELLEKTPEGTLECVGSGKLMGKIFSSNVYCTNGQEFSQEINLSGVKNFKKFKAKVYSSLYMQEVEMNFKKI